jgi:hypothetical protein
MVVESLRKPENFLESPRRKPTSADLDWGEDLTVILQTKAQKEKENRNKRPKIIKDRLAAIVLGLSIATVGAQVIPPILDYGNRIIEAYNENNSDKEFANLDTDKYIKQFKERFPKVVLGNNFSPEEHGLTPSNINTETGKKARKNAMAELDLMQKVGMKDARIGIRMDTPFEFYKPFLDKMLANGWNVTVNFGIKVNRWPEQHMPEQYQDELTYVSEHSGVITLESNLGKVGIASQKELLQKIKDTYPPELVKNLIYQVNNEAFWLYGLKPVKMDKDYQKKSIKIIRSYFPEAKIDNNSTGFIDADEYIEMYQELIDEDHEISKHLIFSVNDYSASLQKINTPFGQIDPVSWPVIQKINIKSIDKVSFNAYERVRAFCEKYVIPFRIEEAGLSAYDDKKLPDPVWSVKYELVSSAGIMPNDEKTVILVWDFLKVKDIPEVVKIFIGINKKS